IACRRCRKFEQRECAEDMRGCNGSGWMQVRLIQFRDAGDAEQPKRDANLDLKQLKDSVDAGFTGRRESIEVQPSERYRVGTHGNAFHHIGATTEAAVDDDLRSTADRIDDFGENIDRAAPMIELASAVVGDVDAVDSMINGDE